MKLDKITICVIWVALVFGFLFAVKSILTPFIVAIIIAYFLDPLADKITNRYLPRTYSTLVILGIFITIVIAILILIFPLLYSQFDSLINAIPDYFEIFIHDFYPQVVTFGDKYGVELSTDLKSYLNQDNITNFFGLSGNILGSIMESGIVLINVLSLIFITPILIFYILRDWDIMVGKVNNHLPLGYAKGIREVFTEIHKTLYGYVHGQINVCIILGIFYAVALHFSGLDFGLLVGFLTGFFSFIPYVGMLIGVAIAIIVALFQWGFDVINIGIVLLIFTIGQILEGNFLSPKLVGDKVGLHPVWIIFGIFVFGVLFGFMGVLLAMPATAICGVLIKFSVAKYKKRFV
jgi:predicted PurR-regulated permease PerM